jgi:signal transduction histidine kinase/ActR/RegA family two-component response regulator
MSVETPPASPLANAVGRWFEELDDRGVFITDDRLIVRRWNHWLAAQTGRASADMVGRPLLEVFPLFVDRGIDGYYRDALGGGVRVLSERFHKYLLPIIRNFHGAGLTEMSQTARIEPLFDGQTVVGTITLIEDVTERVIAERELRNQIAASEQARRLAEDTSRLKDEFLATLSHEIRTPLNAVIGWTRILRTQPSIRSRAHALEVIERNAVSQLRLIEDLLDMARIISGKLRLKIDAVSIGEIAQAAVDVNTPAAAAKEITIETAFEDDLPPVNGDAERLQQVIWNLLSNAVKFTEAGGRITLAAKRVGANIRLSVTDTGQGIAADFLPFVFDRFRQADASASRRHGGLGLGLALVRQIVELHGGAVGVESAGVGQGTSVWITLPAMKIGDQPPTPAFVPAEPVTLKGVQILIVDDENDARELMVAMLQEYGAIVRAVESADAALGILNGDGFVPDVLVSDVGMPGTDGFALVREIRKLPSERTRRLPAIAVTAYANPEDRVRALVAGFQNHIPKPVDASVLAIAIARLVAGNQPPADRTA